MRVVLVCALMVAFTAGEQPNCHCEFRPPSGGGFLAHLMSGRQATRTDVNEHRISDLSNGVTVLQERLDAKIVEREKAFEHVLDLEDRVDHLESSNCGKREFQCGDMEHHCISDLLVCDGSKDCDNNHDEDGHVCENSAGAGSVLEGDITKNTCAGYEHMAHIRVSVTGERRLHWFQSVAHMTVTLHFTDDDGKVHDSENEARYYYAHHHLIVYPSGGARFGLVCDFVGAHHDHCDATVVHEGSLHECAHAVLTKTH